MIKEALWRFYKIYSIVSENKYIVKNEDTVCICVLLYTVQNKCKKYDVYTSLHENLYICKLYNVRNIMCTLHYTRSCTYVYCIQ